MKRAFTLLEIIVVLIIIGIISTLGFTQYMRVIEKGRTVEAKSNLGTIRTMAVANYEENGVYPDQAYLGTVLGLPTAACNTSYYFMYNISGGVGGTGTGTATRCTAGGKTPNIAAASAYSLSLTPAGAGSSNPVGWW